MDAFRAAVELQLQELATLAPRIGVAALLFLVVLAAGRGLAAGVERVLDQAGRRTSYQLLVRRIVRWVFVLLGVVLAMQVLGLTALASSLLATGGIAAIILGFAFKDIGENLLAGLFLAFGRSFDVGDLIESSGLRGVVRAVDLRHTHIRTGDGCDIFIPSAGIFRNPLHNFTRDGLRRGSFTVGIDYRDDPERACSILREAVSRVEPVLADPPVVTEIAGFNPAFQELQVYLWIDTTRGPGLGQVRTLAMAAARTALQDAGYTFSSDVSTAVELAPVELLRPQE